MSDDQVNKNFTQFCGKNVTLALKSGDELVGELVTVDNFLNSVIKIDGELKVIKGGNLLFISINE